MINFVLCDDNIPSLNRLAKMLESIFMRHNIEAKLGALTSTPDEVLEYVQNNKVDVLILDINLNSKLSGCDIADHVRKKNKNVYIVFLTGHLEYALLAYKYKTFDYIAKPIVDERLEECVLRLVDDMSSETADYIRINNNKTIINANDVNYIKKDGMKLLLCTNSGVYETYSSFSRLENSLPKNFVRCHKSYIVNINNITSLKASNNTLELKNNQICHIGAKYKNSFMEVLNNGDFTNHLEHINNRR